LSRMKTQISISRRHFIKGNLAAALAASTFPTSIPSSVLGADGQVAPSNKIVVGAIGVGPQGRGDMGNFLSQADAQVVALCDVLKRNLDAAVNEVNARYKNKDVATVSDFRELLARKDIDAVLIATPDHWHVPVAIAAAMAGKDIYLEKPMGLSVQEDMMLRKICQEKQRIFQFGTQQRSDAKFRKACELVRNGRIGKLKQIKVWCAASRPGGPTDPVPVPEGLNYDLWLGPAPQKPYTEGKAFDTAKSWKTWWFNSDYALGFVAGWGVHPLDIALWGYPEMMTTPMEVTGKAVFPKEGACNTSVAWDVNFSLADGVKMQFRGVRNGCEANELNDMEPWKAKYHEVRDHGTAFEGSDGWVVVDRSKIWSSPETLVEEKFDDFKVKLTRSSHHVRNLLNGIKNRKAAICPIEEAVQADVLCHLSDIATRLNRPLKFDPVKEQFLGNEEANARLALRPMRTPWNL
ncbi:MAG: Gfo/Idh/MocA family oxidoreductase, partial [Verrucomicrobia bacterium]|nr:Gfo/Idh/MocA family oxidoreductase [Verrucomicrobiota bacterium]